MLVSGGIGCGQIRQDRFAFAGSFEIICGFFVLIGLLTRLAGVPLLIIMLFALTTTKAPMFADKGFRQTLHESHIAWAMLLSTIFLLIKRRRILVG